MVPRDLTPSKCLPNGLEGPDTRQSGTYTLHTSLTAVTKFTLVQQVRGFLLEFRVGQTLTNRGPRGG